MLALLYTAPVGMCCDQHQIKPTKCHRPATLDEKNPHMRGVGLNRSRKNKTGTISTLTELKDHSRRFVFFPLLIK